jgi:tetratricopeptide (TPR) repeat protein
MRTDVVRYDVFVSYWSGDAEAVEPLRAALERAGLRVWVDSGRIEEHASISREVRDGIAASKVLLAYYSATYPSRRACQWELTAAFTAAQRLGDPLKRVLAVNPERTSDGRLSVEHVLPGALRDARFPDIAELSGGPDGLARWAARVVRLVAALEGPLGGGASRPPGEVGRRLVADPGFVGRLSDLWRIHSELSASDSVLITGASAGEVAMLAGLGGVGKSALADEYALRFGAAYPGGVFWLSASGASAEQADGGGRDAARDTQMQLIAAQLGLDVQGLPSTLVHGGVARELERRDRCLWIVDDLPDELSSERARAWLAPHPNARTLITTRSRRYEFAPRIDLDCLGEQDSLQVLTSARGPQSVGEWEQARAITQALGGHPLALRVAAYILGLEGDGDLFARFRARLADPGADEMELAKLLRPELPNGHEPSIAATLLRSISTLQDPALDLLRIASCLTAAPIPRWFLAEVYQRADALPLDQAQTRVRDAVHLTSVVSLSDPADADGAAIRVHPLVSRTIRFHESRSERREELYQATTGELGTALDAVDDYHAHERISELIPHWRGMASEHGPEPPSLPRMRILAEVARYDYVRGDYELAEQSLRTVLERYRESPEYGDSHPATLQAANLYALVESQRGALDRAQELQERVARLMEDRHGPEHADTLSALNNLGLTLHAQEQFERSLEIQRKVLDARRRTLGDEDLDTLSSAALVAKGMVELGDRREARELLQDTLAATRRVAGEDSRDTMIVMRGLAGVLHEDDKLEDAGELLEDALRIARELLRDQHPVILAISKELAEVLSAQDRLPQARALLEPTLSATRDAFGDTDPNTLDAIQLLAEIKFREGEHAASYELQEELVASTKHVYGLEHWRTQGAMLDLAAALRHNGTHQQRRDAYEPLLDCYEAILAGDRPEELRVYEKLGELLYRITELAGDLRSEGQAIEARELYERVLAVARPTIGDEHETTLHAINDLAVILMQQGDHDSVSRANTLLDELVETRTRVLGANDQETSNAIDNRDAARELVSNRPTPRRARRQTKPKPGRNDPCHCGSAKKYKRCHLQSDQEAGSA